MAPAQASASRRAPVSGAGSIGRVRWDRIGRVAMLCVLAALLYLYLSAGVRLFETWREARGDSAQLVALEHEHTQLQRRHQALARQGTVEGEARQLNMMNPGEQPYVVAGLPSN